MTTLKNMPLIPFSALPGAVMRSFSLSGLILSPAVTLHLPYSAPRSNFLSYSVSNTVLCGFLYPNMTINIILKNSLPLIFMIQSHAKPRGHIIWCQWTKTPSCILFFFFFFFYWISSSRHVLLKSSVAGSHTPSLSTSCISNCLL